MNPFAPELRTMAVVNRWSVVFTLMKDNLATHSYFVAMYSDAIAELIGWHGNRGNLLYYALTHDCEEVATGDLVSPSKRAIIDQDRYDKYVAKQLTLKMPAVMSRLNRLNESSDIIEIENIVTAADRLDALLFLEVERRMGNQHMNGRTNDAQERLREAWMLLPAPHLNLLWSTVVLPSINEHRTMGGSGV